MEKSKRRYPLNSILKDMLRWK